MTISYSVGFLHLQILIIMDIGCNDATSILNLLFLSVRYGGKVWQNEIIIFFILFTYPYLYIFLPYSYFILYMFSLHPPLPYPWLNPIGYHQA
jgi:hypothetical protein